MPTTIIEPATAILNITVTASTGRVVDHNTLPNGYAAIAPNNSRIGLENLSLTPPRNANSITGEFIFPVTASTVDGEYRIIELPSIADTAGNAVGADREIERITVDLAEGKRPRVKTRNFDPIIADTPEYTFEFTVTDENAVDVASIVSGDIQITGPRSFNKTASQIVSITPNSNAASVVVRCKVAGPFAAVDDGTYQIRVAEGNISDVNGNLNRATTVGTFAVSITPNPGTQGVLTDFRGRTAVPSGWNVSTTPEFLPTGMKITSNGRWFARTISGPTFPMAEGADIQVDFIPGTKKQTSEAEAAVGLSSLYDIFNSNSCLVWFDTGGVWTGTAGVFTAPAFTPNVAHRMRLQAFQGNLIVTFSRLFSGSYVQVAQTSTPIPSKLLTGGGIYLDAKDSDLIIIQVVSKAPPAQ